MKWFPTIIRVAGTQFPGASALAQLWSEVEADALTTRVKKLEDPISFLHQDVPEVSRAIYSAMRSENSSNLNFDDDFYSRYSRSLAALDANNHISCKHRLGSNLPIGIRVSDPSYTMYLCNLFEDDLKMEQLIEKMENCKIGEWLNGTPLAEESKLPLPVVEACFDIYESKGYGIRSRTIGRPAYCGKA